MKPGDIQEYWERRWTLREEYEARCLNVWRREGDDGLADLQPAMKSELNQALYDLECHYCCSISDEDIEYPRCFGPFSDCPRFDCRVPESLWHDSSKWDGYVSPRILEQYRKPFNADPDCYDYDDSAGSAWPEVYYVED